MKLKNKARLLASALSITAAVAVMASSAHAVSIDWKGTYRFEWTQVEKPALSDAGSYGSKAYGLNYLSLSPKIIAADGVNIVSKFDVLSNQNGYQDDQFGQLFGESTRIGGKPHENNVFAQNQPSTGLRVQELYLNINQEFGALVVGRAPLEFGLGITHNAGNGDFDHWSDSLDMVGYKFIVDNFFVMPIFGRTHSNIYQGQAVQDMIIHAEYNSKESGSMIGVMYQSRKASPSANDVPTGTGTPGSSASGGLPGAVGGTRGEFNLTSTNFVLGREWEKFAFKLEAAFNSGGLGAKTSTGQDISANGYGIAAELLFPRKDSKFEYLVRLGMATGDDPGTPGTYEGFQFDRNYDVAFLLFNHRLGRNYDYLSTNLIKDPTLDVSTSLDDEAISNAVYVSPKISYAWNDRLDLNNSFTYAQLVNSPNAGISADKALGFEWDIELAYRPTERLQWVNQIGVLMPGAAFKNGTDNLDAGTTYGFASKVAVSF